MPRKSPGARLHWRTGTATRSGVWQIRDTGDIRLSTGTNSRPEAERQLQAYLDRKHRPSGPTRATEITVGQILEIYAGEHAPNVADPARIAYAIDALAPFWGDLWVSDLKGETCRRYAKSRRNARTGNPVSAGTVRRELGTLQAALNYCAGEGYLLEAPKVVLPDSPPPKERWLTRQEAAWLLRGARALNRDGRHLADFILCGLYTGSRKDTILRLHIDTPSTRGGWIDTRNGILYRKPSEKTETKKRQRPARLPKRYLAHVRR